MCALGSLSIMDGAQNLISCVKMARSEQGVWKSRNLESRIGTLMGKDAEPEPETETEEEQ